ncbi:hypothetical protein C8J56DRAFT_849194 [Mycena floridula]|nr:hypothetical protein C8J56DRAFT_849194 [Mycena floridula]
MPATDRTDQPSQMDSDREKDRDDRGSKQKSASSKAKDLSHVPCKFFRVGSCTAGASCPFSHTMGEPGAHKEVCAWFVKGNCKFGHKCALAHILPGQSMAMDRKNKKAAQVAAGGAKERDGNGKGRGKKEGQAPIARNPSLQSKGRPPITMPLKASISAPAPALQDTDFVSFGVLDEDALPNAPALAAPPTQDTEKSSEPASAASGPLPVSSSRRPNQSSPHRAPVDFGPIGSPPRSGSHTASSPLGHGGSPSRLNGTNFLSTSPFSAPGPQSMFVNYGENGKSGIAASLGNPLAVGMNRPSSIQKSGEYEFEVFDENIGRRRKVTDSAVDDGDMEDFLPSSLTDLLTPEERQRRMSRSNSGQGAASALQGEGLAVPGGGPSNASSGHRYSRSVPAPSLLGDISSIWTSPAQPASPSRLAGFGSGTPSSFTSTSPSFGGRGFDPLGDDMDMMNPSNASAAFLPGIHQQYLNSKAQQRESSSSMLGRGIRNSSNTLVPHTAQPYSLGLRQPSSSGSPLQTYGLSRTPTSSSFEPLPSPTNNNSTVNSTNLSSFRPIQQQQQQQKNQLDSNGDTQILSPGARALQAHAPGQSLPQGLAAGYSRIHALPPLPPLMSPGSNIGGFSVSPNNAFATNGPYGMNTTVGNDWNNSYHQQPNGVPSSEFNALVSKLSYSAAAARSPAPAPTSTSTPNSGTSGPPGISRRWGPPPTQSSQAGALSPLSGGVVAAADDDELFAMDG